MAGTEEKCERLLIVWNPPTKVVWWNVLLMLTRLCCAIGIVCGLPVVGRNFLENGPPCVVGMSWPLPSGPMSILNEHFWPHPCSGSD